MLSGFVLLVVKVGNRFIGTLDHPTANDGLARLARYDHEIVSTDVTDEVTGVALFAYRLNEQSRGMNDDQISGFVAILVVVRFEVVQVAIAHRKLGAGGESLLDDPLDHDVAGKLGEWVSARLLLSAANDHLDPSFELEGIDRLDDVVVGTLAQSRDLVVYLILASEHDDRNEGGREVALQLLASF